MQDYFVHIRKFEPKTKIDVCNCFGRNGSQIVQAYSHVQRFFQLLSQFVQFVVREGMHKLLDKPKAWGRHTKVR